jgi:hypothetical protein
MSPDFEPSGTPSKAETRAACSALKFAVILSADFMFLRLTTVHENARSALECGGLTPP